MLLKVGVKSSIVETVQEWLNQLGYKHECPNGNTEPLDEDGIFGAKTEVVVKSFQQDEGLSVDGIVGPNTLKALEKAYYEALRDRDSPVESLLSSTNYTLERVNADKYDVGYNRFKLRNDIANA